ncbi:MAG: hypothetical protein JXA33_28490 [Anaerolineae bacterium]|nr:hypothetical protein [Anaerolineae bacterium]
MKPWPLLIVGLLIGLAGGLVYTWVLAPPAYYDTYPPLMRNDFRADWIRMTAFAYGIEGDMQRTQLRLQDLSEAETRAALTGALDDAITTGRPLEELKRLAELALMYGIDTPAVHIYLEDEMSSLSPTPTTFVTTPTPAPTPTASPTPTAFPTLTPEPTLPTPLLTFSPTVEFTNTDMITGTLPVTATTSQTPTLPPLNILPTPQPALPYMIISQTVTCTAQPRIAISLVTTHTVKVYGREREETVGLPAQEIWLSWDEGADRAVTGMKPEMGLGYADFIVTPQRLYKLYIGTPVGIPIATLQIEACLGPTETLWATWSLTIRPHPPKAVSD